MARLGAFCFPGTGHINPMTALARALERRGHQVVIFGIADTEARVRAAGIEYHRIGDQDYPLGTLRRLDEQLGQMKGLATFKFTVERVRNTARMILRDGPAAVRAAKVEALLVDEADMGGSVAEHLGLPFLSIAMFPPLIQDDRIPPFCFGWEPGLDSLSRLRNRLGVRLLSRVAAPIFKVVNDQRRAWGLKPLKRSTDALSPLAQIAQLPAALDFEVPGRPSFLHYTGPFVDHQQRPPVPFPWERLDGRPLIYASLGTLQNGSESIFRTIAEACAGLDAQLVLSLGGGLDPARLGALPGDPLVVAYAPQLEIVKRAALVITHAGLNTVLESLAEGVPLVAIPQGNDQPGVAARVKARGAGLVVPASRVTVPKLRAAVSAVLADPLYRRAAQSLQQAMAGINGPAMAAEIIERTLLLRRDPAFQPGREPQGRISLADPAPAVAD
ncbi:glycosyltransferase [Acidobacteria bacterium AB60]|nr:glycosyltransferase [Acidobacteria bacterium AB60]